VLCALHGVQQQFLIHKWPSLPTVKDNLRRKCCSLPFQRLLPSSALAFFLFFPPFIEKKRNATLVNHSISLIKDQGHERALLKYKRQGRKLH